MLRLLLVFAVSLFFTGCQCSGSRNNLLRVGVDPNWYPVDFGNQDAYVNGFVEDFLFEVAQYSGIEFEKVTANWDTLLEGIQRKNYDVILSSLPPYNYNTAKFDFSENFLDLGPVLIVPYESSFSKLSQMKSEIIGVITGNTAVLALQKYPDIVIRNYPSLPDLFNAVLRGEIDGALHDRIPAFNYVRDLYQGKLKIVGSPLNNAGLHLVAPKGEYDHLIKKFDTSLERMKKKKKLQALLDKWQLGS